MAHFSWFKYFYCVHLVFNLLRKLVVRVERGASHFDLMICDVSMLVLFVVLSEL